MRTMLAYAVMIVCGCVGTPKPPTGVPTAFRTSYQGTLWPALEQALVAEGFAAELLTSTAESQGTSNVLDESEQAEMSWVFRVGRDGLSPPLSTEEAARVMARLKVSLRRAVNATPQGEPLSTEEGEAYQERKLVMQYRVDRVFGTATLAWTPWTHDGELVNRVTLVLREQAPRE